MPSRFPQDYLQSAQRRLTNAADLYRQTAARQYDDAFLELADVGMLVWSAGIDVLSALMARDGLRQAGARPPTGTDTCAIVCTDVIRDGI